MVGANQTMFKLDSVSHQAENEGVFINADIDT